MISRFRITFFSILLICSTGLFSQDSTGLIRERFLLRAMTNASDAFLRTHLREFGLSTNGSHDEILYRVLNLYDLTNKRPLAVSSNVSSTNKKTSRFSDPLIIEHADHVRYFHIDKYNDEIVEITGGVLLSYQGTLLQADSIRINTDSKKVYGTGHVRLKEEERLIYGESFIYDMDTRQTAVWTAESVIDDILYTAEEIKTLKDDFYRISKGRFSTCQLKEPHYSLKARKIFIYPDKSFYLTHITYYIGSLPLFYFPVLFRLKKGTGIHSFGGFSSDKGYYLQNTYQFGKENFFKANLKADYYQFSGPMTGLDMKTFPESFRSDLSVNIARYRSEWRTNSSYKTRWYISGKQNLILRQNEAGRTTLSGYYFNTSDERFISDYFTDRQVKSGIANLNQLGSSSESSASIPPTGTTHYLTLQDIRGPSVLTIRADWQMHWVASRSAYLLSRSSLPALSYSLSGTVTEPEKPSTNSSWKKRFSYFFADNITWAFSYSFSGINIYDETKEDYLKRESKQDGYLSLRKSFNFGSFMTYYPRVYFHAALKNADSMTTAEKLNYQAESFTSLKLLDSFQINLHQFYKLLAPELHASHTAQITRTLEQDILNPDRTTYGTMRRHTLNLSSDLRTGPLTYRVSTSANLRTLTNEKLNVLDRNRYGSLQQSLDLKPFSFLNINNSYSWSIRNEKPLINTMKAFFVFPKLSIGKFLIDRSFWNLSWQNNFVNPRQNSLSSSFSASIKPFSHTTMNLSINSKNENLYVYSDSSLKKQGYPQTEKRSFFSDLADSFNFFDIEKRKSTYFKLKSVSINLSRDLHCWKLTGGYSLSQRNTYLGNYLGLLLPYWEHRLWVQINLLSFGNVEFKKEEKSGDPALLYQ